MESVELVVSAKTMTRIFVFILYVPICLFVYWRLIPRLSTTSKRLASFMLVAQVTVIVVSLEMQSYSSIERWLWDIKTEWNIPATLASTQLALVAGVALLTAWLARVRPAWQRFYLVATGLVFLFLALDEYLTLHEGTPNWERNYTALGALVVVATVLVAVRSPRRAWIWHLCLLTGLAMSAAGGILLRAAADNPRQFRIAVLRQKSAIFSLGRILRVSRDLAGAGCHTWPVFRHGADATSPRPATLVYFAGALDSPDLSQFSYPPPRTAASGSAGHCKVRVGCAFAWLPRGPTEPGASVYGLYASARQRDHMGFGIGMGYSVHLVDQVNGDSVAKP